MIQLNHFNFNYGKRQLMFQDFCLDLKPGAIYGLLGKNGAGKSTLLKNIVGSLHPISGSCTINNVEIKNRKPSALQQVYFIPEQITLPSVRVSTFLKMNSSFYPNFSKDTFEKIIKEFELDENPKLNQLSHGQQKKVALAFGIATNTQWLILDEPTNGLDIPSKSSFRRVISNHIADDKGIIISTHQIADIEKIIENLIVIDNGALILNQSLSEVASKLTFALVNHQPKENEDMLYHESFGVGAKVIQKNQTGNEGAVDLETLFNALISHQSEIINHLS